MKKRRSGARPPKFALFALFLLFALGLFGAYRGVRVCAASGAAAVSAQQVTVHRGKTFTVDVDLSGNGGLVSLALSLEYDEAAMRLVGIERGSALGDLTFTVTNPQTELGYGIGPVRMLWDGRVSDGTSGRLARLTFESFASAAVGTYPVTLTCDASNTNRTYGQPAAVETASGAVTLERGEYEAVYLDFDGRELYRKDYNADDLPAFAGELPTRPADERYSYAFAGWQGVVSEREDLLLYQARYTCTPQRYRVFYYVDGCDTGSFDGTVDAADFFAMSEEDYGAYLGDDYPQKARHVFSGWFTDPACTTPLEQAVMPAHDLSLYGYFVYDIRTVQTPKIRLSCAENGDDTVTVSADMTVNTGLNAMLLTLSFDGEALELIGFARGETFAALQFDATDAAGGSAIPRKFYFEHSENTYETGVFLSLTFQIKRAAGVGVYPVTFTLGNTDATYQNGRNGIRYTAVEIVGTQVPVGKLYRWESDALDDAAVTVTSDAGLPADTVLRVFSVPERRHRAESRAVEEAAGRGVEIKAVYDLCLLRVSGDTETEVAPNGTLTVEIALDDAARKVGKLTLYRVGEDGELVLQPFERSDGVLRFQTDRLSRVVLAGRREGALSGAAVMLVTLPLLLAIATMAYALILTGKRRKTKGAPAI